MGLSVYEKNVLIDLARSTVKGFMEKGLQDDLAVDEGGLPQSLTKKKGVFVAIYRGSELKGCMGNVLAVMPIWLSCIENARNASYKDPRFTPLHINELDYLSFEIAIIDTPRPLSDISELQAGIHGIILTKGFRKEVFLPGSLEDVPHNKGEFFANLKAKVGMNDDDHDAPEMWEIFNAEVISERARDFRP